jgi:hypothetical protein
MDTVTYKRVTKFVDWDKIYPNYGYLDFGQNKKTEAMNGWESDFSNAQGYGIFCGKKCVARKQAEGIPPKRGKKNIAAWEQRQAEMQAQYAGAQAAGNSKAPIIIASLIGVAAIVGIVIYIKRKK